MLAVFALVALVVIFVMAAVVVGRESSRLSVEAPRPVFDLDEAVPWVSDRVPFEVSAVLSHDDVRRMLRWNLADLQAAAAPATEPTDEDDDGALPASPLTVMGEQAAVAAVQARADAEGLAYTDDQVRAVLDAHLAYLEVIGAVGPAEGVAAAASGPDGGVGEGVADDEKKPGHPPTGGATMSAPEKGGGPAEQTL